MPEEIIPTYALVVGDRGVGKTTLISGISKLSCNKSFVLIDGSGCEDADAIQKLIQADRNLDHTRISAVFLVIKYDTRFERMPDDYFAMEDALQAYADRIVIMVSHFDYSKSPEKDQIGIHEVFKEECPNVKNLRCYSAEAIDEPLASYMNDCILKLTGNPLMEDHHKSSMESGKSSNDVIKCARSGSAISHAESSKPTEKALASDISPDERSGSNEEKKGLTSETVVRNDCSSSIPEEREKKWHQRPFCCCF